jgi:hypothetical protein
LFRYWNERRARGLRRSAPDIEPGAIRHVPGDTFVLEAYSGVGQPFRIAGTRLYALFGCELKGGASIRLWQRPNQNALRELIGVVMERRSGRSPASPGRLPTTRCRP